MTFRLKQFEVCQERSALKVGTDGMLLAAFLAQHLSSTPPRQLLDVGTGTGIIALMLAQVFETCHVTGIEIDRPSAEEATLNASRSPFAERLTIICGDYSQYRPAEPLPLIVSNPPYYTPTQHNSSERETIAKHAIALTPETFFAHSQKLLAPSGIIATIIATSALPLFTRAAHESHLVPAHQVLIHTRIGKDPKRAITLWQDRNGIGEATESHLAILAGPGRHHYTAEYAQLLRPYLIIL